MRRTLVFHTINQKYIFINLPKYVNNRVGIVYLYGHNVNRKGVYILFCSLIL